MTLTKFGRYWFVFLALLLLFLVVRASGADVWNLFAPPGTVFTFSGGDVVPGANISLSGDGGCYTTHSVHEYDYTNSDVFWFQATVTYLYDRSVDLDGTVRENEGVWRHWQGAVFAVGDTILVSGYVGPDLNVTFNTPGLPACLTSFSEIHFTVTDIGYSVTPTPSSTPTISPTVPPTPSDDGWYGVPCQVEVGAGTPTPVSTTTYNVLTNGSFETGGLTPFYSTFGGFYDWQVLYPNPPGPNRYVYDGQAAAWFPAEAGVVSELRYDLWLPPSVAGYQVEYGFHYIADLTETVATGFSVVGFQPYNGQQFSYDFYLDPNQAGWQHISFRDDSNGGGVVLFVRPITTLNGLGVYIDSVYAVVFDPATDTLPDCIDPVDLTPSPTPSPIPNSTSTPLATATNWFVTGTPLPTIDPIVIITPQPTTCPVAIPTIDIAGVGTLPEFGICFQPYDITLPTWYAQFGLPTIEALMGILVVVVVFSWIRQR